MPSKNPIDEKKNNSKPSAIINNYVSFLKALGNLVLVILITLFFGSSILYCCKVATANILPTEVDCTPYTTHDPDITPIDVDINVNKINGKYYSTKINFPFNESPNKDINKIANFNKSNTILEWVRKQKETYNSWGIKMYFLSVLEGMILKNYSIINSIFHFMNKYLYEFLTILFGPWLFLVLIPLITIFMFFYSIYLWFVEFNWLFRENKNTQEGNYPVWENVTFMEGYSFCISCILALVMLIFIGIMYSLGFIVVNGVTSLIFLSCLVSAMMMKSLISDGENMMQSYGIGKTFTDLLFSKMHLIMIIISVMMIIYAFTYLGGISGAFAIIAILVLFVGLIGNSLYNRQIPKDSTEGLTNEEVDQAKKICTKIAQTMRGGGIDVLTQLKNLSKSLKQK